MSRAPFQVLVFPYYIQDTESVKYAIFRRSDGDHYWQAIAGGGEAAETPIEAAKREAFEEAGIPSDNEFIDLESTTTIPVVNVSGFMWGENVLVIPEHAFGVEVQSHTVRLSAEHTAVEWLDYQSAMTRLRWDGNKNALWELNIRVQRKMARG